MSNLVSAKYLTDVVVYKSPLDSSKGVKCIVQDKVQQEYSRAMDLEKTAHSVLNFSILNFSKRTITSLICHPYPPLYPESTFQGIDLEVLLKEHPELLPFVYDIAQVVENEGNKPLADEMIKWAMHIHRVSSSWCNGPFSGRHGKCRSMP